MSPYRIIISAAVVGVIVMAVLVVGFLLTKPQNPLVTAGAHTELPLAPVVPAAPSVSFTVVKSKTPGGNQFMVQWQNLPDGTVALNIYRAAANASSTWTLWQTISLANGELASGLRSFSIGDQTFAGYSFYAQAVGNDNSSGTDIGTNNGLGTLPLWTSSSTFPTITTSTPTSTTSGNGGSPSNQDNSGSGNSSGNNTSSTGSQNNSNSSSSNQTQNASSSGSGDQSGSGSGNGNQTNSNQIPYYNPQIQISGYGTPQTGSFWAQYNNQTLELGWQGLPTNVTSITVFRSTSSTGPWAQLITQGNPAPSSTYSLQVVDNSLHQPYYYEMTAYAGTSTIGTYGPVYLGGQ